jgi:hypothetical protein
VDRNGNVVDLLDTYLHRNLECELSGSALKELLILGFDLEKSPIFYYHFDRLVMGYQNLAIFIEFGKVPAFDPARHFDVIVFYFAGMTYAQRDDDEPDGINWDHVKLLLEMGYTCANKDNFEKNLQMVFEIHENFRTWELVMEHRRALPEPIAPLC